MRTLKIKSREYARAAKFVIINDNCLSWGLGAIDVDEWKLYDMQIGDWYSHQDIYSGYMELFEAYAVEMLTKGGVPASEIIISGEIDR